MQEIECWSLRDLETDDVKVHSVYDGDTLKLALPVCCKHYIFNCRLNGVDTPELRTSNKAEKELGYKVRDYIRELLKDAVIRVQCLDFDKYGRLLCNIIIKNQDSEYSLSEHLIEKGYAYAYNGGTKQDWSNLLKE